MNRRRFISQSPFFGNAALCFAAEKDSHSSTGQSIIVATQYGKVRGASLQGVSIFRGIPYAGPSEGAGRFLPPTRPAKWTGVRNATETGPRCIQGSGNIFLNPTIGEYFRGSKTRTELAQQHDSENCLVLNVLTPGTRGKRPVMVYVHGGGFTGGSSLLTLFANDFPREQDVVLVGINHRLNVFGYLYLGDLSEKYATGNAGQLDLIAALEWVRDNIGNFGGDPKNVTIFGESGGAAKISTLLAMPGAQGLYHKAILESGSLLRVAKREEATATARTLLGRLGITEKQLDRLQTVAASDLFAASSRLPSGPVIDGRSLTQQIWDPKAPDISAHIPLIIGCCKDESTLFSVRDESLFHLDEAGLRDRIMKAELPETEAGELIAAYHKNHPKDTPSDIYFRFATDRGARWNAVRQAELKLEQAKANVYTYYFAWDTPCGAGKLKAFHTAELPLALRLVRYPESEQLSKQISGAWAAFARSGIPAHPGLPKWPAYSMSQRTTMIFNADRSEALNDPDREQRILLQNRPSRSLL